MFKSLLSGALFLGAVFVSSPVHSNSVDHQAVLVDQHISSTMQNAELATYAIAEVFKKRELNGWSMHQHLKGYLDHLPEVRAITIVNANGDLVHDSFMFPFWPKNLADREYFEQAKARKGKAIYVGRVLKGRTSGLPFLPVSRAIYEEDKFLGVVTMIITPNELLTHGQWTNCKHCYVEVMRADYTLLAQHPAGVDRPEGYIEDIRLDDNSANGRVGGVRFHEIKANVSWIRNKDYPLITVYMEPDFVSSQKLKK
jgi:hypothetical protein